jgi:hypothetical protein
MKTHNWILPAGRHAKTGPVIRAAEAIQADSPAQAARGILVLSLVLGGLGTEGTALVTSSNAIAGASALPAGSVHAVANPWML